MAKSSERLTINLLDNGVHSLKQGLRAYERFDFTKDVMLLKDAVIYLHHGVELLMKEILVRHSPFLIFEDLRDVPKKQKQADSLGIGIFFIDRPPKTVTYDDAIARVEAFVRPPQLSEELKELFEQLNRLRNQMEHYAIDVEKDTVTQLLGNIQQPLLNLLDRTLGIAPLLQEPEVVTVWNKARRIAEENAALETRVVGVMQLAKGQRLSGKLFNTKGDVAIPVFSEVTRERVYELGYSRHPYRADVFGISDDEIWAVIVKKVVKRTEHYQRLIFQKQILTRKAEANKKRAILWFAIFGNVHDEIRDWAQSHDVLISGRRELKRLEESLRKA